MAHDRHGDRGSDEQRGRQIAAAYAAAPVYDPAAIPAYRAFIKETGRQFDFLTRAIDHRD